MSKNLIKASLALVAGLMLSAGAFGCAANKAGGKVATCSCPDCKACCGDKCSECTKPCCKPA